MVGNIICDKEGNPLNNGGQKLSASSFQPPIEVRKFFGHFQRDYLTAWLLQRKPLDEFDGYSLLDRTKLDQETFGAFVGVEFLPVHKRWKWKGRKNTARNKLIGILAHLIAGMLFPFVYAQNERDEEDKMTARVMGIMVEEHLRKAGYEIKFLYLTLSALVNPAIFASVEYVESLQKIKQQLKTGEIKIIEAVDDMLSGTMLHILPIDELLLGDFYSGTGVIHTQPFIFRQRRISYDYAKSIHAKKYFENGKDLFDYVEAGKTRWMSGDENNTLFDVEWSEADGNFVQEVTGYWRSEDLEVVFVGGIPMCNYKNIYNSNPFSHRRMVLQKNEWLTVPVYPFAMSGFEPIDPNGRFVYFKSGAFKEYWEDKKLNEIDRLLVDGVKLDVMKPIFASGVAKFDSTVMVPGATVAMPLNTKIDAYSLGSNLTAAYKVIMDANQDLSESTQDKVMQGSTQPGITATQTVVAQRQARIFLGVFGLMIANLVKQIGELAMDCVIQYGTVGELDALLPESLRMKYKVFLAKGKDKGKNVTNRIVFSDRYMGKNLSKKEASEREWELFEQAGGENTDQRIYEVNPYRFARTRYSMFVDADKIVARSMGTDRQEKELAFERLTDPRVMPFTDPEAVANDFVIEEYADGDPDRYKAKKGQEEMMASLLGQAGQAKRSVSSKEEIPTY
mgnify:FL=1